jgi:hypothetical protein
MARKPFMTSTHSHFKVKAKNLKKKDHLSLLGTSATVIDVDNAPGAKDVEITVRLNRPPFREVGIVIAKKQKVTVYENETKSYPENR